MFSKCPFFNINVRENRKDNKGWTTKRNMKYWAQKTQNEDKENKKHNIEN